MATPPTPSPSGNRWSHVTLTASPFPSSSVIKPQPQGKTTRKSMEQVWNEIKLGPLFDVSSATTTTTTNNRSSSARNVLLHDFSTAGPFTKHVFSACACNPISSAAQPSTTLSFISSSDAFYKHHNNNSNSFLSPFDTSKSCAATCPSNTNKKVHQDVCVPSDPRHQRMIKNRESAVRSRARKQAYKNALELKLVRLTEENSRLRQQVEDLQLRLASSAKHPKMRTLYRTSTSPF